MQTLKRGQPCLLTVDVGASEVVQRYVPDDVSVRRSALERFLQRKRETSAKSSTERIDDLQMLSYLIHVATQASAGQSHIAEEAIRRYACRQAIGDGNEAPKSLLCAAAFDG